jgi:hypothetical protein
MLDARRQSEENGKWIKDLQHKANTFIVYELINGRQSDDRCSPPKYIV